MDRLLIHQLQSGRLKDGILMMLQSGRLKRKAADEATVLKAEKTDC